MRKVVMNRNERRKIYFYGTKTKNHRTGWIDSIFKKKRMKLHWRNAIETNE